MKRIKFIFMCGWEEADWADECILNANDIKIDGTS